MIPNIIQFISRGSVITDSGNDYHAKHEYRPRNLYLYVYVLSHKLIREWLCSLSLDHVTSWIRFDMLSLFYIMRMVERHNAGFSYQRSI